MNEQINLSILIQIIAIYIGVMVLHKIALYIINK